jgi:hypothetical protein
MIYTRPSVRMAGTMLARNVPSVPRSHINEVQPHRVHRQHPPTPNTCPGLPLVEPLQSPQTSAALAMADRKKRDRYAGPAYEFGANAALNAGGAPPAQQAAPGYGAPAPAFGAQQQQAYGAPAPSYGAPAPGYGAPSPGYGAPSPSYGAPGYGQPAAQDPNALSQQFGQMNMGPQPGQAAPQAQQPAAAAQQNQLFPSDLIAQPFHVSELYNPPPPINLPANAAATPSEFANESSKYLRCTLNTIPTNHSLLKKSKLPFALVISPYASLHDSEDPVPVVHDQVISRCRRCRAYSMFKSVLLPSKGANTKSSQPLRCTLRLECDPESPSTDFELTSGPVIPRSWTQVEVQHVQPDK